MTASEVEVAPGDVLAGLELLTLMPPEVRELVSACFVTKRFHVGELVVRQGDPADGYYVIVSGRARVVATGDDDSEVPLVDLGPGDGFGEMGLLRADGTRTASVRVSQPSEMLRLDGSVLRGLASTNAVVRQHLELLYRRHALRSLLRGSSPFARLAAGSLLQLLAELEEVQVGAGDVVASQGQTPDGLLIVEEGRLRALPKDGEVPAEAEEYVPGDVLGEHPMLTGIPWPSTVEAVSASRLLLLPGRTFDRLLGEDEEFRRRVEERAAQYDFQRLARVPADFGEELLPAEAEPAPLVAAKVEAPDARPAPLRHRNGRFRHVRQVDEMDCGAACLAMVCRDYGRVVSLARCRQAARTGIDGTSLMGISRGADDLGLGARALKRPGRSLDGLALPAVLHWDKNHWVVLYRVDGSTVRVADPALGLRKLARSEAEERWSGYYVAFTPTERFDAAPEDRVGTRWLVPFLRPHRRTITAATLLALVVSGLQLVVPVFTQVVVDRVLPGRDMGLLRVLLLALAGVLVVSSVASLAQRYLLSRAAGKLDGSVLDFLTTKLLALPMPYFYARRTGDIQRRLAGMRLVREFTVQSGVVAITAGAQLLAAVVLMVIYSRMLTGVFLAVIPLYVLLMRLAVTRLRTVFESLEEGFGRYASHQFDAVKGIETVKAMGAEDRLRAEMVREFEAVSGLLFRADFVSMCYEGAVHLLGFISLGLFLWVGSLQVLDGTLSLGRLVSFSALVALANGPIVTLLSLWDQVQFHRVLVTRVEDVFAEEPEQGADRSRLRPVERLHGGVKLDRLTFRYGSRGTADVLTDISLDIAPGTRVAIVGRSGSGKTTLLKCMTGLIEPTEGRILYDGADMATLDLRSLRRHLGVVLQENFLFSDTIARNVAFRDDEPDMERVAAACEVAHAHEFIARLPLGYDTRVGETGLLLSGGQRQRIAIALAVYGRPPVLLFDEATSALDVESEQAVQQSMQRLLAGRTSFVIAHRLSTIRNADLIVVLERGRLVEQGTHDELMTRRGLYFYLCSQQLGL